MKIVVAAILIASILVGGTYVAGRASCEAKTYDLEVPGRFELVGGCEVHVYADGVAQWIPVEAYIAARNAGLK